MRGEQQEVLGGAEAGSGGVAPPGSELPAAEGCFAAGDFREARRLAEAAARSDDPAIRAAANALAEKMQADPAAGWMALGCLALFAVVVWLTLLR